EPAPGLATADDDPARGFAGLFVGRPWRAGVRACQSRPVSVAGVSRTQGGVCERPRLRGVVAGGVRGGGRAAGVAAGPGWMLAAGRVVAALAGLVIGPLTRTARGRVAWPAVARARVTRTRVTGTPGARRPRTAGAPGAAGAPGGPRLPAAPRH